MQGSKPWYKSKGVWGGILTFIFSVFSIWYNVDVGQETVDELATNIVEIATAGAGVLAIVGRIMANTKIGK